MDMRAGLRGGVTGSLVLGKARGKSLPTGGVVGVACPLSESSELELEFELDLLNDAMCIENGLPGTSGMASLSVGLGSPHQSASPKSSTRQADVSFKDLSLTDDVSLSTSGGSSRWRLSWSTGGVVIWTWMWGVAGMTLKRGRGEPSSVVLSLRRSVELERATLVVRARLVERERLGVRSALGVQGHAPPGVLASEGESGVPHREP
jgi:hypothetical protein